MSTLSRDLPVLDAMADDVDGLIVLLVGALQMLGPNTTERRREWAIALFAELVPHYRVVLEMTRSAGTAWPRDPHLPTDTIPTRN